MSKAYNIFQMIQSKRKARFRTHRSYINYNNNSFKLYSENFVSTSIGLNHKKGLMLPEMTDNEKTKLIKRRPSL